MVFSRCALSASCELRAGVSKVKTSHSLAWIFRFHRAAECYYKAHWCFEDWSPFSTFAGGCDDERTPFNWDEKSLCFCGVGSSIFPTLNCCSLWAFFPLESSLNLVASRDDLL